MKAFRLILLLTSFLCVSSCDDIIEEDISDENIQIVSPVHGATIYSNAVNFQWTEIDGADKYRIQIFQNSQAVIIDSLVTSSDCSFALSPGGYQWRVRGENFAYETPYTFPAGFTLFQSDDLTSQQVFLANPSNGLYTNSETLTFSWHEIASATSYDFQLVNVTNGQNIIHNEEDIATSSYSLPSNVINGVNAEYQWKVRAKNSESSTLFFSRTFRFDNVPPSSPQNLSPANNSISVSNTTIIFSWTEASDSGPVQSPITYKIEIATDSGFTNIVTNTSVNDTDHQQVFTILGDYFWRVKAVDAAGNIGVASAYSKFTIN